MIWIDVNSENLNGTRIRSEQVPNCDTRKPLWRSEPLWVEMMACINDESAGWVDAHTRTYCNRIFYVGTVTGSMANISCMISPLNVVYDDVICLTGRPVRNDMLSVKARSGTPPQGTPSYVRVQAPQRLNMIVMWTWCQWAPCWLCRGTAPSWTLWQE